MLGIGTAAMVVGAALISWGFFATVPCEDSCPNGFGFYATGAVLVGGGLAMISVGGIWNHRTHVGVRTLLRTPEPAMRGATFRVALGGFEVSGRF